MENDRARTPTRNTSLAPIYGRDITPTVNIGSFSPFGSSWDLPSTSVSRAGVADALAASESPGVRSHPNSTFASMVSSTNNSHSHGDDPMSTGSRMDDADDLHIQKSVILEQLRNMTSEVDRLESRLQAAKRKRARAVAAAIERHQRIQETEAVEMRTVLGSINSMTLSETKKDKTSTTEVPFSKTLLGSMSAPTLSTVNIEAIRRLQDFTNVTFTSIHNRIVSTSETGVRVREYQMTGSCFHLEFDVHFNVEEPSLELAKVRVTVPRGSRAELSHLVSRTERNSQLLLFFQTLSQYAQMDRDRSNLINNLAKRFPELVKSNHSPKSTGAGRGAKSIRSRLPSLETLPGGPGVQTLVFCGPRMSSPELILQWVIHVTKEGRVAPRIQLLPRMHQKWKLADTKLTLDEIPSQFTRLLQLKGTEEATAVLLQCVYGRTSGDEE
ncbi:centromere protein P [Entomortierella parvispora]|uniref:Centromere protein P n=1 Tax=Entomortierella parvispora TaxID=205924 RepID=A0A9P3HKV5_9FUNG|nr:centromere protein P [Entomortierella parvispora]